MPRVLEYDLFEFQELTEEAMVRARKEIIHDDKVHRDKSRKEFKKNIRKKIHFRISSQHGRIKSIMRRNTHIHKCETDQKYLENYIKSNLCHFSEDGHYFTYSSKTFPYVGVKL